MLAPMEGGFGGGLTLKGVDCENPMRGSPKGKAHRGQGFGGGLTLKGVNCENPTLRGSSKGKVQR